MRLGVSALGNFGRLRPRAWWIQCFRLSHHRVMEFEPLIKEMERVMMPELQQRRDALTSDSRFADVRVASMRHADVLHTIGLTCHPIASSSPHDSYSIAVNIIAHRGLMMRGFVTGASHTTTN